MFCTRCGNRAEQTDRFCTRCGNILTVHPAQQPSQQPYQQSSRPAQQGYQQPVQQVYQQPVQLSAASPAEAVALVIQTSRKLSAFHSIPCYVVFMRDRVVFAHLSPERQKFENEQASQNVKAQGLGFFKGSAAMMHYWAEYSRKYYSMNTAAILAEDPMNTVIYHAMISEVYFRCYSQDYDHEDNSSSTTSGKLQFSFSGGELIRLDHTQTNSKSVHDTLTGLFASRLKYKR